MKLNSILRNLLLPVNISLLYCLRERSLNPKKDFLRNVFLRLKHDGGYRMILNLKQFNRYVDYAHFKMESLQNILDLVTENCFMCILDLSNAYLMVPIGRKYIQFLKFWFNGKVYCYVCLPFGISSAPRKFTKLLKPIIAWLRQHCIVLVIYIDDIWITATTYLECLTSMYKAAECLSLVGFLINSKKSMPEPSHVVTALGYVINSMKMLISLPQKKEYDVLHHCDTLYRSQSSTIRYVAQVLGKLIACFPVLPDGRTHYHFLERDKVHALQLNNSNYNCIMSLSWNAKKELLWWMQNLPAAAAPIHRGPVSHTMYMDASDFGWGVFCPPFFTSGFFDDLEYVQSINTKETLAIWFGILSFLRYLQNNNVLIRSDSMTAGAYVSKFGGMNDLFGDKIAHFIWQLAQEYNFWINISYIPGKENPADGPSRSLNHNIEWSLPRDCFIAITKCFGFPSINLFASCLNAQLPSYVSWLPDPYCTQVDAFTLHWQSFYAYAFPPFILLSRVIAKTRRDRATVLLVCPLWPSKQWFLMIIQMLIAHP